VSDEGREISGEEVRRRRDRLLDRFGDVPVRERRKEPAPEREIAEETGIEATVTGLGHLRHEVAVCEGFDDRLHVLRAFFTADYVDGSIAVQPWEVVGAAWFAAPPAEERLLAATRRLLDGREG